MKHTQGPWISCREGACICGQVWSKPADRPVANVIRGEWGDSPQMSYGSVDPEAAKANAQLIAAAPELLEALTTLLDSLGALSNHHELSGWMTKDESDKIYAVLAKATGGKS